VQRVTALGAILPLPGGVDVPSVLGSPSTYVPAGLGGLDGRALRAGDSLGIGAEVLDDGSAETPVEFRLEFGDAWTLRATRGSEFDWLDEQSRGAVFGARYLVSAHSDRMGVALDGPRLTSRSTGQLDSTPVFPGTLQCPESGRPYLLGVDAQTTGGYPRIAEVIRADRYLIGQLRPGCQLRLLERTPELARREFANSLGYWREWLPDAGNIL
jgi:allophanate hydrolase subunit 2